MAAILANRVPRDDTRPADPALVLALDVVFLTGQRQFPEAALLQVLHASLLAASQGTAPPLPPRDAEQLGRKLRPVLDDLARIELGDYDRDLAYLRLLLRRLRDVVDVA